MMATCAVKWRPSGGRGEFEFVPADTLADREISIDIPALGLRFPTEVRGVVAQGKPRLRKADPNNRKKFHLPQLVMAIAALPEPARSDQSGGVSFPLEAKAFVMDEMDFDIIEDDGLSIILEPLRVSVLHSDFQVQLGDRFAAIARDFDRIAAIREYSPASADAITDHRQALAAQANDFSIRKTADRLIELKSELFGPTNSGSVSKLLDADRLPEVGEEAELTATEGRLLTRLHVYKERDKGFATRVKKHYKAANGGTLSCQGCGLNATAVYGPDGDAVIEAHHTVPIAELQPDSISHVNEMAVVCASCHRMIHSRTPCLTLDELRSLLIGSAQGGK